MVSIATMAEMAFARGEFDSRRLQNKRGLNEKSCYNK